MIWIKHLICPHHGNEVLRLRQIDDIVRVSRQHMNCLDLISGYLKLDYFISSNLPFLNEAVTGYNNEELPLGVMPVLSLCDPGFADIHGELAMISGFQKFRKRRPGHHNSFSGRKRPSPSGDRRDTWNTASSQSFRGNRRHDQSSAADHGRYEKHSTI